MDTSRNILQRLQNWYRDRCDGDWEHTYGITIGNIDNPGWTLSVELQDTYLSGVDFQEIDIQRSAENDWCQCKVIDEVFKGYCGPENLEEMLNKFLTWSEMHHEP